MFGRSISGFGVFLGNPDLEPEESESWEVGFEQSFLHGRLRFGATYYDNDVTNLIVGGVTTNENIGQANLSGSEAFVTALPTDKLTIDARYAYTRAKDGVSDRDLLRRPRHKASFDIAYRPREGLRLSAEGIYVGKRVDGDAISFARIESPSYFVLDLFASYDLTENFQIFGRIENALDRDFEEPDGFTQPGIAGFVGLRGRF